MTIIEKIGKCCLHSNWIIALALTPIILTSTFLFLKYRDVHLMEERVEQSFLNSKYTLKKRFLRERFLDRFCDSDPFFIDKHLESLNFLNEEKNFTQLLLEHPAFGTNQMLRKRWAFLTDGGNRLAFAEEAIQSSHLVNETEEHQIHPIEVNLSDVLKLLSRIENRQIGPYKPLPHGPQLLVKNFHLTKQTRSSGEVFVLSLDLLKREFFRIKKES